MSGMAKRLYIFGAGASCTQGLPAMASLTWEVCNFLSDDDRIIFEQVVFEAFGARRECEDSSPNFEDLLNYLDPRSFTYLANCGIDLSGAARMRAIEIALRGLREFIRTKCALLQDQFGPYDEFVANMEPNATIVSFNWDVLLELALLRARKAFFYLPDHGGLADYTLVLKPHGSINWFALLDRELLMIDTTANVDVIGDLRYYLVYLKNPLGAVDMGTSSPFAKSALSKVPAIVPPSSAKLLNVGGQTRDDIVDRGHREALCTIWKHFYEHVRIAEELVVAGYSLPGTDASAIEVLKQFLHHTAGRRVLIIDRNPAVLLRYRNIVHPEAKLIGQDFGKFDWGAL